MKKIIAMCLVLLMAISMVTVSASPAGSANDPLISQRHLEGQFAESLRSDIYASFSAAAAPAMSRLNDLYLEAAGYVFAPRFTHLTIPAGGSVSLASGASFVLLSGSATLTVGSGTVINISTGTPVLTGSAVSLNQRLFCAENTTAVITATTQATGHVDGFYYADDTIRPIPPVTPPTTPNQPTPGGQHQFTDVPATAWFSPAVDFVFQNGLFAGTSATTFSPNTPMTRGMFVTVLHRLDGLPETAGAATFSDVRDPSAFFFDAVAWASDTGIVTGFADGTFRPNDSVTREQMAAIMHRYAEHTGRSMAVHETALDNFPDRGNISVFARESMQWAVSWQVIRGSSGGRLLPGDTATRAEVAQIVLNYTTHVGSQ